jgi:hypothetical protein
MPFAADDSPVTVRGGSISAWTKDSGHWQSFNGVPAGTRDNAYWTAIPDASYKQHILIEDQGLKVVEISESTAWEIDVNDRDSNGNPTILTSGIKLCSEEPTKDRTTGNYTCPQGPASDVAKIYMLVMDVNLDELHHDIGIDEDSKDDDHPNNVTFHRKDASCPKCEYASFITITPSTGFQTPYRCHDSGCAVGLSAN